MKQASNFSLGFLFCAAFLLFTGQQHQDTDLTTAGCARKMSKPNRSSAFPACHFKKSWQKSLLYSSKHPPSFFSLNQFHVLFHLQLQGLQLFFWPINLVSLALPLLCLPLL